MLYVMNAKRRAVAKNENTKLNLIATGVMLAFAIIVLCLYAILSS
jgi:hypothetical protein